VEVVEMDRGEALSLVKEHVKNPRHFKHVLAVEAIMREIAREVGGDEEKWGLVGLLHDLDFDLTEGNPEKHTQIASEILKGKVSDDIIRAIRSHNFEHTGEKPETLLEKFLVASDAVSGLIVATALVMPGKKLGEVKVKSLKKKFKAKDFARGVDRERILFCEDAGMPLDKFLEVALRGMKKVAEQIGL